MCTSLFLSFRIEGMEDARAFSKSSEIVLWCKAHTYR